MVFPIVLVLASLWEWGVLKLLDPKVRLSLQNENKPSILGRPLFVHNPPFVNAGETWGNSAASNFRLLSRGGSRSEASGFSMDWEVKGLNAAVSENCCLIEICLDICIYIYTYIHVYVHKHVCVVYIYI